MTNDQLRRLRVVYYSFYLFTVAMIAIMMYMWQDMSYYKGYVPALFQPRETSGMILQYILIGITLGGVVGGLYYGRRKASALSEEEDEVEKYRGYTKMATIRMIMVGSGMVLCTLGYFLLNRYDPMMWLAAISMVAFVFCRPSEDKADAELRPRDEQY